LVIINDKKIMGEYVNKKAFNIIIWITTILMIGLTIFLFISMLR